MAKISLTKENVKYIRDAFSHFFPEDTVYSADKPYTSGEFNWVNRGKFIDFINRLIKESGIQIRDEKDFVNIKRAQLAVEQFVETEEKKPESNTLTEEQREQFEKERAKREALEKKSVATAKAGVETAIKTQQEIFRKEAEKAKQAEAVLKQEKVYIKVDKTPAPKTENVEKLRQQAKADGPATAEVIEGEIKARVPNIPDLAAKQASLDIVQNLQTEGVPSIQTAVFSTLASNPKQIDGSIKNKSFLTDLKNWIQVLSDQKLTEQEISRAVTLAAFGDAFQKEVLPDFIISFSQTPGENFREFTFDQVSAEYSSLMHRQSSFLEGLEDFGIEKVRTHILSKINSFLTEKIASLPADSALRRFFDNEIVKTLLPGVGLGTPAAWQAVEGSFLGKIAVGSGFAPVLGWLGEKTGIDFGIKKVVQVAAKKGVEKVTGVGLAATITAACAWAGPFAPIIGAVGAFLIEVVGAKIINKVVDWVKSKAPKIKENLIAISGGMLATGLLIFPNTVFGAALSIGGGVGLFGGVASGGLASIGPSITKIGTGIGTFFKALGGAFLKEIGMPILVTLLVFPVVVALILFIINSGAYVVPGGVSGTAGGCSTEIADRAGAIAKNLTLGFDHYYNHSSDYPELWNAALFAQNPNTPESQIGAEDMFWCNYMATKSFLAINEDIPFPLPTMVTYFKGEPGKWADNANNTATYNDVCPGDAIFFYNSLDPPNSISHVGVVAGVTPGGITTDESNSPYPNSSYPTDSSGHFEPIPFTTINGIHGTINILGFGKP